MNRLFAAKPAGRGPDPDIRWRLRGALLDAMGFKADATLVFSGGRIEQVIDGDPARDDDAKTVVVKGLIVPGFVDAHNHLPWSVFRRWVPSSPLRGRFDWRGKTRCGIWVNTDPHPYYRAVVDRPFKALRDRGFLISLIEHGLVRGLIGGATTAIVDADLDAKKPPLVLGGSVRAVGDGAANTWGILDIGCISEDQRVAMREALSHGGRLLVHLGEGSDDVSRGEFSTLSSTGLLAPGTALIHGFALALSEWEAVRAARARVVWSPSSNLSLYGRTLDVRLLAQLGIPVALAPDWAVTGSPTILDEVAFVRKEFPWMTPAQLLEMVTRTPAEILGIEAGLLIPGKLADAVVLGNDRPRSRSDALQAFASARVDDVQLVVVEGVPAYGTSDLIRAAPAMQEPEELEFEFEGRVLSRHLRFRAASGESFAQLRDAVGKALTDEGRAIAPLWE